jgi:hypothetical protein
MALKKQFNAIRYTDPQWLVENGRPWLQDIHRGTHARPFRNPAKVWERFFANLKEGKKGGEEAHEPRLRKRGRCRTRDGSVQPWQRCGGDGPSRSQERHACQIRRWSTGQVGAESEPCALLRTFLIAETTSGRMKG